MPSASRSCQLSLSRRLAVTRPCITWPLDANSERRLPLRQRPALSHQFTTLIRPHRKANQTSPSMFHGQFRCRLIDSARHELLLSDGILTKRPRLAHYSDTKSALDFFHVCEHIDDACYVQYAEEVPTKDKVKTLKDKLQNGQLTALVHCLLQFGAT